MSETTIRKAMVTEDYDLPVFIAKSADAGEVTKAELGELLNRRVTMLKQPQESFQQAYNRLLAQGQDYAGARVFKTYMALRGPNEHHTAVLAERSEQPTNSGAGATTPLQELQVMADELRKGTDLSAEQAFAKVVQTPAGLALYRADKDLRLGTC